MIQRHPVVLALALALLTLACAWLTGWVRRYALDTHMIDHPNERSSHRIPTPRGGGVSIVACFSASLVVLWNSGQLPVNWLPGLLGASLFVAAVGFADDRGSLPARWRLLAHIGAAVWALAWMKGIPPVPLFGKAVDLGWFGLAVAAAYLVWMVNLYNFMDGIDGIAGIQTVTVGAGGALCCWFADTGGNFGWFMAASLAFCALGFLFWNYPPAKIFLGDVGSGFIGSVLGILSLWTAQQETQIFWSWFVVGGCFMVDATTTLVRRVRRGERFDTPHRTHAYQHASIKYRSHKVVSLSIGTINLLWLLPIALLIATKRIDGALGALIAFSPLVWLVFHFKAGDRAAHFE